MNLILVHEYTFPRFQIICEYILFFVKHLLDIALQDKIYGLDF